MNTRSLTEAFLQDLTAGRLKSLGKAIREDDTLLPGLRGTQLDVYYRGGVLFSLVHGGKDKPVAGFYDVKYAKFSSADAVVHEWTIANAGESELLVDRIYNLKRQVDQHHFNISKNEREVQQLIAWENNLSKVAHETDYFIADIELADTSLGARCDMVGVRWASRRKGADAVVVPALIEIKHGIGALDGSSGLAKHLQDMLAFIADRQRWENYLTDLEEQLAQLVTLGAIRWNGADKRRMRIDRDVVPEILFILANYNPASDKLQTFLDKPTQETGTADVRFSVSCFAGYGLYAASTLQRAEFRALVNAMLPDAKQRDLLLEQ